MKTQVLKPPLFWLAAAWVLLASGVPEARAQFTANTKMGIGATGVIVTNAAGSYSVLAGGQDIFGGGDDFTFHNFSSQGTQFDLRVRVANLEPNARLSRAGLMVRQNFATNSRMAFVRVTPVGTALNGETGANDVRFQYRTGTTSAAQGQNEDPVAGFPAPAYPNAWVRIERHGNIIGGYSSTDGINWQLLGNQDTTTWEGGAFPTSFFLGLAQSRNPRGAKPTNNVEYRNMTAVGNFPPVISDLPNVAITEDSVTGTLGFVIGDFETIPSNLVVTASSGNLTLVPAAGITLSGTGASRSVVVRPATNQTGVAIITITVSDGVRTASDRFQLTVNPVNDPPVIGFIQNQTINEDTTMGPISFSVTDPDSTGLTITGFADQPGLVPTNNIGFGGSGNTRNISITPAPNQFGTTRIGIQVSDGFVTTTSFFTLTILPVNDPPTISDILDRTIPANSSTGQIGFTVGDVETPPGNLTLTRQSDNLSLVPLAGIVLGGGGTSGGARTVTVSPAVNQFGTATITVTVSDGTNTASDTFLVNVTPIAPAFASLPQSQTAAEGDSVTFAAQATGTPPLTFQWSRNGQPITGASANAYTIPSVRLADAGSFTVAVNGPGGSTSSPPAVLTVQQLDFGDAPDRPYPTTLGANGARHTIVQGIFLGSRVDGETNGQQNATATGDDIVPTTADDEDGVRFLTPLVPGQPAAVEVIASVTGRLDAWIDYDINGSWVETPDRIFSSRLLVPGPNNLAVTVPAAAKVGATFARFRFSTLGDLNFIGPASNGEVEDYQVMIQTQALDFGDAPAVYRTLLADNGPSHIIVSGFHLGALEDAEPDGQPSADALGDDNPTPAGGSDDEDGVNFVSPIVSGQSAQIQVVASATGRLDAWLDFNGNGSFLDPGEQIFTSQVLATGVNPLSFGVPAGLAPRDTYARFRFSQQGGLRPEGAAQNGEVEDYRVSIEPAQLDFGDAPQNYPVLLGNNGARHRVSELRMGQFIDVEPNGQPSGDALGDDAVVAGQPDDEDGVKFLTPLIPGQSAQVEVTVNLKCHLEAWVDFNLNGSWADTNEQIFAVQPLDPGPNVLTFTVPPGALTRTTYARFRVSEKGALPFVGFAPEGEVEDYRIDIEDRQLDFGDAPQNYPVLLGNNGARHIIVPGFHLGVREDAEPNGQPSADALGDDGPAGALDDEDGVRFLTPLIPGQSTAVEVTASAPGRLNAWVDFNINGSWADDLEHVFIDVNIPAGATTLSFFVPSFATPRATYARFRFNTDGKLNYDGFAPDGEVEDYRVEQGRPRDCDQNCTGTNFWLAFPGNYAPDTNNPVRLSLCIIGTPGTAVDVRVPGLGFNLPFAIPAGGVALIPLPRTADLGDSNDAVTKKGVVVNSSGPISVEALSHVKYTTDGYAAFPSAALGTEYIVSAFGNVHTGARDLNGTQFAVAACDDNTRVRITPRAAVEGHPANVPYIVLLQAGETYQLRDTSDAPADLTGTLIEADKPVAVFGGHQCANVPSPNEWFCDYLVEQLLPTKSWGRAFLTAPLATRASGDTFRILASVNNTGVNINGALVATLDRGEFYETQLTGGSAIAATAPVSVTQYANSSDFDLVTEADPFMVIVPPVPMFNNSHVVCTAPLDFADNYINVIAPNASIGAVTLNGVAIPPAAFTPIGGTLFSYARRAVPVGVHSVVSPSPVGVAIYGWAEYDSYGYTGCLAFGDTTPPTLTCPTTNVTVVLGGTAGTAPCAAVVPDFRSQVTYGDNCGLSSNSFPRQEPAPGTVLGAGVHPIVISVTDLQGNTATCTVTFTVVDPSAPTIQCPSNMVVNCTSPTGAVVRYVATGRTTCIQNLPVQCTPASGTFFPVGATVVSCIASNNNQFATCTFTVTVKCTDLKVAVLNGTPVLTWEAGTLESAPNVTGPWNPEPNARSPFTMTTVGPRRFFRIRLDQ